MKGNKVIRIQYYIDYEKVELDKVKLGIDEIEPLHPIIKNSEGLYWDLGIDLFSPYAFVVQPHTSYTVNSYVGILLEPGVGGLLFPRSGDKHLLGGGVIDTGYLGTIRAMVVNPYDNPLVFKHGDSIGQLVLFQKSHVDGPMLQHIDKDQVNIITTRGTNGRITNEFTL